MGQRQTKGRGERGLGVVLCVLLRLSDGSLIGENNVCLYEEMSMGNADGIPINLINDTS